MRNIGDVSKSEIAKAVKASTNACGKIQPSEGTTMDICFKMVERFDEFAKMAPEEGLQDGEVLEFILDSGRMCRDLSQTKQMRRGCDIAVNTFADKLVVFGGDFPGPDPSLNGRRRISGHGNKKPPVIRRKRRA